MRYSAEDLLEASERYGISFDYLMRLASAGEPDSQDPRGNNILAKQLTVIFDHHVAKCFTDPDPIGALRHAGFTEVADAVAASE